MKLSPAIHQFFDQLLPPNKYGPIERICVNPLSNCMS
jgi:hypothetical protein